MKATSSPVLDGDREGQHHLVEIAFQAFLLGVEVQRDARFPLLAEDRRALRRFKGQVTHIDALQGELRAVRRLPQRRCSLVRSWQSLLVIGSCRDSAVEQRVELAGALQGTTGRRSRRHGWRRSRSAAPRCARPCGLISARTWGWPSTLISFEGHAFAGQQLLGAHAVRAVVAGVDDDLVHVTSPPAGYRRASWHAAGQLGRR